MNNTAHNNIWITGIRRGIGRALALHWAGEGRAVAGCATRADPKLEQELLAAGASGALATAADIRDAAGLRQWAQTARRTTGLPGIIVHNAAMLGPRAPLLDVTTDQWRTVIETNTTSTFYVLKCLAEYADPKTPLLWIWLSSSVAQKGRAGWGPYAASKAALENMHETFAEEIADSPWQSIAVNPGGTRTHMRAEAYPDEDPDTLPTPEIVAAAIAGITATWERGESVNGQRYDIREHLRHGENRN